MGGLGRFPISTLTGNVVPGMRDTLMTSLSVLPAGIVTVVAPLSIVPLMTAIGRIISDGALVVAVALNWPSPTFVSETIIVLESSNEPSIPILSTGSASAGKTFLPASSGVTRRQRSPLFSARSFLIDHPGEAPASSLPDDVTTTLEFSTCPTKIT